MPRLPSPLAFFAVLLALAVPGSAQSPEVEVVGTRFASVRAPNGGAGTWFEATVQLTARPAPGMAGAMVPRVRVALLLGFELPATAASGGERRLEHYRAEAECVALESGRADVRFYLPPELVKRDQLHGDPKYWGIELTAAGRSVAPGRAAYVAALATPEQRRNFQQRGGAAAAANDGLLQPQYLTPFASEYPRATPSFVRREVR